MPKYLGVNIKITTFETYAACVADARAYIREWQESDAEEPPTGIKPKQFKMGWEEFNMTDEQIIEGRNMVLAEFLHMVQKGIPGCPTIPPQKEQSLILHPFDPFPDVPLNQDKQIGKL